MTTTNHRPNSFPAPCCRTHGGERTPEGGEPRVHATCCVDTVAPDSYGVTTVTVQCVCRAHCEYCTPKEAK
jgi:hypothetical protein